MAHCSEIEPLLSAYTDGELTALESEQVTHHLDNCGGCKETLLDYVLLGHHLRSAVAMPSLEGFAESVLNAIPRRRPSLRERFFDWRERMRERWIAAISVTGAAAAMASLALVLWQQPQVVGGIPWLGHRQSGGADAAARSLNRNSTSIQIPDQAQNTAAAAPAAAAQAAPFNSETFISRLESRHPSVAMWSEPDYKTTVIWLGDDASGND